MQVTRTYIGEPGRYYPELAVTPAKGDEVTFADVDQVPDDGRWKVPAKKSAAAKRAAKRAAKSKAAAAADAGGAADEQPDPDAAVAPDEHTDEES